MSAAGIFTRLDTVLLRVRDVAKSKVWYEQVLRLKPVFEDDQEKLVVFDLGGETSLTIWQLKPAQDLRPAGVTGTFPIFLAEDVAQTRDYLIAHQVQVEPVQESGGVRSLGFFDPDGNRLEVCQVL